MRHRGVAARGWGSECVSTRRGAALRGRCRGLGARLAPAEWAIGEGVGAGAGAARGVGGWWGRQDGRCCTAGTGGVKNCQRPLPPGCLLSAYPRLPPTPPSGAPAPNTPCPASPAATSPCAQQERPDGHAGPRPGARLDKDGKPGPERKRSARAHTPELCWHGPPQDPLPLVGREGACLFWGGGGGRTGGG